MAPMELPAGMLIQVPAPPLPPEVVIVGGGGPPEEAIVMMTLAVLVAGFFLLRPLFRAWARRIEGGAAPQELAADVEHLRERLQDVDVLHQRIGELEERLDFAERMLTRGRPESHELASPPPDPKP